MPPATPPAQGQPQTSDPKPAGEAQWKGNTFTPPVVPEIYPSQDEEHSFYLREPAEAPEPPVISAEPEIRPREIQWGAFGTYFTTYYQSKNSADYSSGLLLWSPEFPVDRHWSLVPDLGGTLLRTDDKHNFFAGYAQLRAKYYLDEIWAVDFGGGAQAWIAQGGVFAMAQAAVTYHFSPSAMVHSLRVGAGYVANDKFPTWQVVMGLEFNVGDIL